jgi:gamma-glutamyl phosphate reductase
MKDQIDDFGKALALMPHITTLLKSSIDNNEHLIKMASIVQKSLEKQKTVENDTISIFTEDDKKAFEELALEYESMNMLPTPNISTPVAELPEVIPVKRSKKK